MNSAWPTRAISLGIALMLAACGKQAETPAPTETAETPTVVVAPDATAGQSISYKCDGTGDLQITAVYGTDAAGLPDVALFIRGQDFALSSTPAASGARYASADGLEDGMGLIWWTRGEEAMLQQAPSDLVNDPAAGQTIRTCNVQE